MSKITGNEPQHWHDEKGRHRMPDPRRLAEPEPIMRGGKPTGEMSVPLSRRDICHGDPDQSLYWDHLDAHDREASDPQRRDDDPADIRALFDKIEYNEAQNAIMRELIATKRRQH